MSDSENKFIRQLKITLVVILGPFILTGLVNALFDHYNIKNNQRRIEMFEKAYVTNDMLVIYLDALRRSNEILTQQMNKNEAMDLTEFNRINTRIDEICRDMMPHNTRGDSPVK